METTDEQKEKKILDFLSKEKTKWFTINQIASELKFHHYKIEALMYKLFYENKIEKDDTKNNFVFWRIKK